MNDANESNRPSMPKDSIYSYEDIWHVLEFLADEKNIPVETFIDDVRQKISAREQKINNLVEEINSLNCHDRQFVLARLNDDLPSPPPSGANSVCHMKDACHSLRELAAMPVNALVRSKPEAIIINNSSFQVRSWKDASIAFVEYLVGHDDLRKENLPLCPNKKSRKAYVNFFAGQPPGTPESGIFEQAAENFFVDIKHNAKYHVLNMLWSLHALGIENKYDIKFVFDPSVAK